VLIHDDLLIIGVRRRYTTLRMIVLLVSEREERVGDADGISSVLIEVGIVGLV
jgi:hypothetical protein